MSNVKLLESVNVFNKWSEIEDLSDKSRIIATSQFFYPIDVSFYVDLLRKKREELVATEIWPSSICNQHCIFCSSDIYKREGIRIMESDVLKKLIIDLSSLGNKLVRFSGGGEPFLCDLTKKSNIIELIAKKQMHSLFITNGSLLNKETINMLAKFSSVVRVSFNGGNESDYEVAHGINSFHKVIRNMRELSAKRIIEKREQELLLGATFIVTQWNFKHISEAVSIIKGCGLDFILVRGLNPVRYRFSGADYDLFYSELKKSHEMKSSDFFVSGSISKLDGSRNKKKNSRNCYVCNFRLFINTDGFVYPCFSAIMHERNCLGNIYRSPITNIWGNRRHIMLKRNLNNGIFPGFCNKFCDHIEFNDFIDWTKKRLENNIHAMFRRIPRAWAEAFMDNEYKVPF